MGLTTHSIEGLHPPFEMVDEMIFYIPKADHISTRQKLSKFIFVLDGEAQYEINGITGRHSIKAGDILISLGGNDHHYINPHTRRDCQLHVIRLFFNYSLIQNSLRKQSKLPEDDLSDYLTNHYPTPVHLRNGINVKITELINKISRVAENKPKGYLHRVQSACIELVLEVAEQSQAANSSQPEEQKNENNPIVASAKEYILKNLDSKLKLSDIARRTGKGEEHLTRVFKKETGQSVFDYVRDMRISRAKTFLFDPSLTLTQIAELCGFTSLSYFSQTFTAATGTPPSTYRAKLQSEVVPAPYRINLR